MDIDKLKELKTLLDEKVITQEEFEKEKAKIINNNETFEPEVKKPKGKGIASMVLGILAVIFSLSALGGIEENFAELFYYDFAFVVGFGFGYILFQSVLAIISVSLAYSERKHNKNGFNTAGLWLSISSFILIILTIILMSYYY